MSNHSLPFSLQRCAEFGDSMRPDSEVRWARNSPNACVIFVHGFNGSAVETWGDFGRLAVADQEFSRADLYFLSYESRTRPAVFNVAALYQIVKCVAEQSTVIHRHIRGRERSEPFSYDLIVLVGHSLGGALVRQLAMLAKREEREWAERLRLVLLAPAHVGANIIELAQQGWGFLKWMGPLEALAIYFFPVLRDLRKDSDFLKQLKKAAKKIGLHRTSRAHTVVHASDDKVVFQDLFYKDPPTTPYEGKDHGSCCKPSVGGFAKPLRDLAGALK